MGKETLCLFYPNPIETGLEETTAHAGSQKSYPQRISAYRNRSDFKERLARIYVCYVDIDLKTCKTTEERVQLVELVENPPIKPSVIVHSGNGFHLYFSIKPICLLEYGVDEPRRSWLEGRFLAVQMALCEIFQGDSAVAKKLTGRLRIPNTNNIKKNPKEPRTKCSYYYSSKSIESTRINPDYKLEELEVELGITPPLEPGAQIPIANRRPKLTTPTPKYAGFLEFVKKLESELGLKFRVFEKRYLKFLYGHRDLGLIIEATLKRKEKEQNRSYSGASIKKVRDKLIAKGLLELVEQFYLAKRMGWEYRLTDAFYTLGGISKSIKTGANRKVSALAKVQAYHYEKGQRLREKGEEGSIIGGIDFDYPLLRGAGFTHEEVREILRAKIDSRPEGLERTEEAKEYVDKHWGNKYNSNFKKKA